MLKDHLVSTASLEVDAEALIVSRSEAVGILMANSRQTTFSSRSRPSAKH